MRYLTAGESHGKALTAIMDGCPANLNLTEEYINKQLVRRQQGYGRGERMKIESDSAEILSGVRNNLTLGSPIALLINNKDFENWREYMSAGQCDIESRKLTLVRPAHADLSGALKYNQKDARNILERASARETAARVAVGAVARRFLEELGVTIGSHTVSIGNIYSDYVAAKAADVINADENQVRCPDSKASQKMIDLITVAKNNGDTLGGSFRIIVGGFGAGYGSHTQYDKKLDALIMSDIGSIQSVKSVSIGLGAKYADKLGSQSHDEIGYAKDKFFRYTNNSGGIDGGITTGEDIIINAAVKPVPTLAKGLKTVDLTTHREGLSARERSDVCVVAAAAVVAENVVALTLMEIVLQTLGGDHMDEIKERWFAKQKI